MRKFTLLSFLLLFISVSLFAMDESEGNDTFATADQISTGFYIVEINGTISPGDSDFFVFDVNPLNTLTVNITFGPTIYDVNVYDSLQVLVTSFGESHGTSGTLYIAVDDGPNWIEVTNASGITNYQITIENLDDPTLPVELSSFTANVTASNFVSVEWITQSESDMLGYNVLRSESAEIGEALLVSDGLIPAQNQSIETAYQFVDQDVEMQHTYWYWLESVDASNESEQYGPISVTLTGGGGGGGDTPDVVWVTALENNFPNPFNPSTCIVYTLAEDSVVDVAVYNNRGQLVRLLHDNNTQGRHSIVWNGLDSTGAPCSSGVYYFHLNAGGTTDVIKGILMK